LTCGHTSANNNGHPGADKREWFCELCAQHVVAKLDQEIAAVRDWAARKDAE
jgi:hypothetical protein